MTGPAGAAPLLALDGIGKSYGSLLVLDDISLVVPAGQALGIVGPNGAGKSTLLSIVSGTEPAGRGRVEYDGEDVTRVSAARRAQLGVGRSFQVPRPFGGLTVFENALVGATRGARLRHRQARDAALDALEVTGMLGHANEPAESLRLLDRKRLELTRALATRPRLLLLDEIAGGLTESEADELLGTVQRLKDRGVTLVWIEHVVQALVQVVDRLVCLAFGTVISDGPPAEVLTSREVVEVYLGSTAGSMNGGSA